MGALKKFIFKKKLNTGNTLKYLEQLQSWQWLDIERVRDMQKHRLTDLLLHAYKNVPYYHKVLKESGVISVQGKVDLTSFHNMPFLTKDILRENFDELKSDDLNSRKWYLNTSGGSTGEPAQFIQDKEYDDWSQAIKFLDDQWSGREINDRQIRLWGSERDLLVGQETLKVRLGRYIRNEKMLNAFQMTPKLMEDYVNIINDFKPVQILSYVESIYELARYIERNKLVVHSPKSIMTSAGTLYPDMRQTIERVFRTVVFNRYGSREVGDIACECENHHGLHVSPLTHYVEIIKNDGRLAAPGEMGEIVITLLINKAMPLIRYRIGDTGVWEEQPCKCGRHWPRLKKITGRVSDHFITKDGSVVHGEFFTRLLYHKEWVNKFQFLQMDYNQIVLKIVLQEDIKDPENNLNSHLELIRKDIQFVMGKECNVKFEFTNHIPPSASGKYRYTISHIR